MLDLNKDLNQLLKKEMSRKEFLLLCVMGIAGVVGISGVLKELASHAATPFVVAESEQGTLSRGAKLVTDAAASGGQVVAFVAPTPVPPPTPPPAPGTRFGACPANPGGESLAAAQTVATKFGNGAFVRQFKGALSNPSISSNFSGVHTSYKPDINSMLSGALDAQVTAMAKATPAGYVLEIWHESDKKVRDGVYTLQQSYDMKNRFYDLVKAANPAVLVANTLTGYEAAPGNPNTHGDISKWSKVRADIIGMDYDGINSWPYPNYNDAQIAVATNFVKTYSSTYKYWAIPEFNSSLAAQDPNATTRTSWAAADAVRFKNAGALYVCWYDYSLSGTGDTMNTAAEINSWKTFVAAGA